VRVRVRVRDGASQSLFSAAQPPSHRRGITW
jgi:hypothetical protein